MSLGPLLHLLRHRFPRLDLTDVFHIEWLALAEPRLASRVQSLEIGIAGHALAGTRMRQQPRCQVDNLTDAAQIRATERSQRDGLHTSHVETNGETPRAQESVDL